jgi:hypothetical protein
VITLDKCLAKNPNARWSNHKELINQLADSFRRIN